MKFLSQNVLAKNDTKIDLSGNQVKAGGSADYLLSKPRTRQST